MLDKGCKNQKLIGKVDELGQSPCPYLLQALKAKKSTRKAKKATSSLANDDEDQVEAEVIKQQETKRGLSIKSEAQDKGIRLLRLRADLQNAIENENYSLAAELCHQARKSGTKSLDTELWFVEWIQCVVNQPPGWKTQMLTTAFICSL
ncbi:hypothetical protein L2E82_42813 [Cichorium intybus]|uniref:Uncharacterized protein n=1 Tax=Cichorium intybus TaxID=13427 RepID=A0ACB8ZMT0_CICIN|nr:hypothetical protein L2E82_42813 [Cichorium intybus]